MRRSCKLMYMTLRSMCNNPATLCRNHTEIIPYWSLFHHLSRCRPRQPGRTLACLHHTPCRWTAGSRRQDLASLLRPAPSAPILAGASPPCRTPISPSSHLQSPPGPAAVWSPLRPGRIGSRQPGAKDAQFKQFHVRWFVVVCREWCRSAQYKHSPLVNHWF